MFRVLSEEESRSVTRWQAPDLGASAGTVANTPQQAHPRQPEKEASVRSLLGSLALKPNAELATSAAPRLQTIGVVDVLASQASSNRHASESISATAVAGDESEAAAHMLQSRYEEGYARGYAEGNAALHQHSVCELRTIISGLCEAGDQYRQADIEQQLVGLSMDIARLVIRREISIDPQTMYDIVVAGLEQLPGTGAAISYVHLHPLDANVVRLHLQEEEAAFRIVDDPLLDRGACRIESGASVVYAGMEDWLQSLSEQLMSVSAP